MDGDNSLYGRYGNFPGRSSFLDSIPPFPWIRHDNPAGHYPSLEDPRFKAPAHYEDPRLKDPHVMEDPRLKMMSHVDDPRFKSQPVVDDPRFKQTHVIDDPRLKPPTTCTSSTYPLFLEAPVVGPQTPRYYNEIPIPNETIYGASYGGHSQPIPGHFSPKDPAIHFRETHKDPTSQFIDNHKDQTGARHPSFYDELTKEANISYENQCQYTNASSDNSDKYQTTERYHGSFRKGSVIGPFTLGYAASSYQTSVPNVGSNTESCPEEVIEKALVSHTLEQSDSGVDANKPDVDDNADKHVIESGSQEPNDNSLSGNITNNEQAVNLSKNNVETENQETVRDINEKDESKDHVKGDSDEDPCSKKGIKNDDSLENKEVETKDNNADHRDKSENEKQSKCIETQTAIDVHQSPKRKSDIDSKSLISILEKLNAKVIKTSTSKSGKGGKNGEQTKDLGTQPKRVIKIIKCFKDKNGKFTPNDRGKCKVIIQKVQAVPKSAKGKTLKRKREMKKVINDSVKTITVRPKTKIRKKSSSDTEEETIEKTTAVNNKNTKTLPKPKVIVVEPTPPKKNSKILSEEEPSSIIKDNDTYSNSTILSLATLPNQLFLGASDNKEHGIGVFCKTEIQRGTRFGPVYGEKLMFQDISPGSDFTHIWCYSKDEDWRDIELIDTSNESKSNWCRYIRPSLNSNCNLMRLKKDNHLYFMSSRVIKPGEELVYYLRYFGGDSSGPHHSASFPEKVNVVDTDSPSQCTHCNLSLSNAINFIKHCQIYHTTGSGKTRSHCRICKAVFLSRRELKKHSKAYHSGHGGEFVCAMCGKTYVYQTDLKEHMKLSHYEQPIKCEECGKMMLNPKKLQAHKQRAHSRQTFTCEKCGKMFTQNSVLQRHKMIHEEVYTVACDRCGKLFRDKHNLKVHLLTHSGVKPFECSVQGCSAAFTVKQCLQGHYRKVHGYTDFNMPPISRSVPFTSDAYMGQEEMATVPSLKF